MASSCWADEGPTPLAREASWEAERSKVGANRERLPLLMRRDAPSMLAAEDECSTGRVYVVDGECQTASDGREHKGTHWQ